MRKKIFAAVVLSALLLAGQIPVKAVPPLIRLHVLAASDSTQDQELKLIVRDKALEAAQDILSGCDQFEDAYAVLDERIDEIERAAACVAEGAPVRASLGVESYPVRDYDGFSLPAGVYHSLKIEIGEAEGKNWWCVVYPSLCMAADSKVDITAALNAQQPLRSAVWDWLVLKWNAVFMKEEAI